jgi:hypothetical protein
MSDASRLQHACLSEPCEARRPQTRQANGCFFFSFLFFWGGDHVCRCVLLEMQFQEG